MGDESQGDFMGDDLGTDVDYLTIEAKGDLQRGAITKDEFNSRMARIDRLIEMEKERDWEPE